MHSQILSPKQIFEEDSKYVFSIEVWDENGLRTRASAVAAMPFLEVSDPLQRYLDRSRSARTRTDVLVTNAHIVSEAHFAPGVLPFRLNRNGKTFYGSAVNINLKRDLLWIKFDGLEADTPTDRAEEGYLTITVA